MTYDTLKANQIKQMLNDKTHRTEFEDALFKGLAAAMDHLFGYVGRVELEAHYGRLTGRATWFGGQITVKIEKI